jgi:hypothetical protein
MFVFCWVAGKKEKNIHFVAKIFIEQRISHQREANKSFFSMLIFLSELK